MPRTKRRSAPDTVSPSVTPHKARVPAHPRAGLMRRLAAWFYDALLALSLLIIAGFAGYGIAWLLQAMGVLQLHPEQDLADWLAGQWLYSLYLGAVVCGFYAWFWCRAGQTLGMHAWRLRVQNRDGSNIRFTQALVRLATAALGLGNLLVPFDRQRLAFQDHWAHCEVVLLTPEENRHQLTK